MTTTLEAPMTTNHAIAKITKAGVACECGTVSADRLAHREHKAAAGTGVAVARCAKAKAPARKAAVVVELPEKFSLSFENIPCDRCGGTGRMPFAAYGGVCFKCNGGKVVLTARGKSARKLWLELTVTASGSVEAWDVAVGSVVSYVGQNRWFTVVERRFDSKSGVRDVDLHHCLGSAVLVAKNGTAHYVTPNTTMAVRPDAATRRAICAEVASRRSGAIITAL